MIRIRLLFTRRSASSHPAAAVLALLFLLPASGWARSFRVTQLPNGSVNNCANCHVNPAGGGARNVFGLAVFAVVGTGSAPFWSPTLAQGDADSDGFSNGTELGDPDGDFLNLGPTSRVSLPGNAASMPPAITIRPTIVNPTITASSFACSVATEVGATYFLEFKPTLSSSNWSTVTQVVGDGSLKVLQDPNPAESQGYYRVRVE